MPVKIMLRTTGPCESIDLSLLLFNLFSVFHMVENHQTESFGHVSTENISGLCYGSGVKVLSEITMGGKRVVVWFGLFCF